MNTDGREYKNERRISGEEKERDFNTKARRHKVSGGAEHRNKRLRSETIAIHESCFLVGAGFIPVHFTIKCK